MEISIDSNLEDTAVHQTREAMMLWAERGSWPRDCYTWLSGARKGWMLSLSSLLFYSNKVYLLPTSSQIVPPIVKVTLLNPVNSFCNFASEKHTKMCLLGHSRACSLLLSVTATMIPLGHLTLSSFVMDGKDSSNLL